MTVLDDILALYPDNTQGDISAKDLRDGFTMGLGSVQSKVVSTGDIQVNKDANFTTILTNTFTNILGTTDLMDGNPHVVTLVMKSGSLEIPDGDPAWGYMLPKQADATGQPIRLKSGGLAGTPNGTIKLWIEKGALVTIQKSNSGDVQSDWEVTHVDIPANGGVNDLLHADGHVVMTSDYEPSGDHAIVDVKFLASNLPHDFKGNTEPDPALGKEHDTYELFPSEADVTLHEGASHRIYQPFNFIIFMDIASDDLKVISINPVTRAVTILYGKNGIPDIGHFSLQVATGTIFPMTTEGHTNSMITAIYGSGADSDVAGITTATSVKVTAKALTGKYQDYVKHDDVWFPTEPYSRVEVTTPFATATPTLAELKTAFATADHHDYKHNHHFYVLNAQGFFLVTYRSHGDVADTGTAYKFYWEKLTHAV